MEREIKFRCWNGEEMVSPDYINRDGSAWWKENGIPTTSKSVMQYTGLKDANGVEVYEGDIVKFTSPEYLYSNDTHEFTSPVIFREGAFTIDLLQSDLHANGDYIHWREATGFNGALSLSSTATGEYFEIVGNIHQHPHLLNQQP